MAITTDRVVVILEAKLDQYSANVRRAETQFGKSMGGMQAASAGLERQISRDAGQISSVMRSLAGTIAAAFSVQQVVGMADSYTRFTNRLKTAGLEGTNLAGVQERLLDVANKNGVEVEALGELYGRLAISSDSLGASSLDLENATKAVAAGLRIQGTSAEAARGGLLQLSQAFASPRVEMEEFGSILDSMPALVSELAKRIPEAGGSVAKLRALIKDRKGAGLSGGDLFSATIASVEALEEKAKKAELTIGNSFVVLANNLTKYIGVSDNSLSATEAISGAIVSLSKNLDTIVPVLANIALIIGGRYLGGLVAAGVATAATTVQTVRATQASTAYALSLAQLAVAQGVGGAAGARLVTSLLAQQAAMTGATLAAAGAGRAILAAFGGPIGLAVTALTVGLGYLAVSSAQASADADTLKSSIAAQAAEFGTLIIKQQNVKDGLGNLTAAERKAITATASLTGEANLLATAWGRVAAAAKEAELANLRAALTKSSSNLVDAGNAYFKKRKNITNRQQGGLNFGDPTLNNGSPGIQKTTAAQDAEIERQTKGEKQDFLQSNLTRKGLEKEIETVEARRLREYKQEVTAPSGGGKADPKKKGGSGESAAKKLADIEEKRLKTAERAFDEEARLVQEELSAKIALTDDIEEKADLQKELLKLEYAERVRQVQNDEDFTKDQKKAQIAYLDRLYGGTPATVDENGLKVAGRASPYAQQIQRDADDKAIEQANAANERAAATLEAMAEIEKDTVLRQQLEREALGIRQGIQKSLLDQQIFNKEIANADEAQVQLAKQQAAARERLRRDQMSPGERYADDLQKTSGEINEAVEGIQIRGLEQLNDELTDAIMGAKSLGEAFSNVAKSIISDLIRIAIQQAIIKPMAEALFGPQGGGSGGGGGLLSFLSKVAGAVGTVAGATGAAPGGSFRGPNTSNVRTGRASGGHVQAGGVYPVGERGEELFQPTVSGKIIPNGQLAPAGGMGQKAVVELHVTRGEMFEAAVTQISGQVSVVMMQQAAPTLVEASANETMRRMSRPKM